MILKSLCDYYNRCSFLPAFGMEEKQIGFLIVIDRNGKFIRFEDCRIDKDTAIIFLVRRSVGRSSAPLANYLYDNSAYVFGYSEKETGKEQLYFDTFRAKIANIAETYPDNSDLRAILAFYNMSRDEIIRQLMSDPLWDEIVKNLTKKYSLFSFRIEADKQIVAEKKEILQLEKVEEKSNKRLCLITGEHTSTVGTTTATMIPGSQATAKLVAFQVKSGYDSYGMEKGDNAPISAKAEFAYTTALNTMLSRDSRNKFTIGGRTFLFWASSNTEAGLEAEASIFDLFGYAENELEDPNIRIEQVRKVFKAIYSGLLHTSSDDRFYILGLAPNSARIAVVYWSETTLREFAGMITRHFDDMEISDTRQKKRPYAGLKDMLGAVTLGGKHTDAAPNLPEAVVKSIFQGLPYPYTLFASAIRRIRAEQDVAPYGNPCRVAILKAYLNRLNDNNKKLTSMLDKENSNPGYLCGRLFAVLDNLQFAANGQNSIRTGYMNAASSTPSAVFPTILRMANAHYNKLAKDKKGLANFFDKQQGEILAMLPDFPDTLTNNDQGRFFIGFHQQKEYKENTQESY